MGAAESRPSPPSWLVEACATLDPRDVDEVVTLFRRAAKNAEAHGEPGASCPANPKDAAAYVFEQERRLGWHEHDASAREASREAFGTPPALDAVLDRLARSVLAGDATTSGTPGAAPRLSAAGDAREKNQPETHGALCAALVARALCRRAACGDGDAVARLVRAVFPKHRNNIGTDFHKTADRTRDALEVARALASVALPPDRTTEDARRRDAFLRRVVATSESIASDDSRGPTFRNERSAFTTLLAQSAYDASMPSRRGRLVPGLFDEDGATRLFAGERDGEASEKRDDGVEKKKKKRRAAYSCASDFPSRRVVPVALDARDVAHEVAPRVLLEDARRVLRRARLSVRGRRPNAGRPRDERRVRRRGRRVGIDIFSVAGVFRGRAELRVFARAHESTLREVTTS
jgi:hypothetical protein